LKHNKFGGKQWRLQLLQTAFLPKKLTQIYHKYLKTAHIEAFFFGFFY
jgi:hypothetical protein